MTSNGWCIHGESMKGDDLLGDDDEKRGSDGSITKA